MKAADPTTLLTEWRSGNRAGNRAALDELFPLVYDDLRRRAHSCLRGERESHTLNTTSLVHETYLKLLDIQRVRVQDRSHFLALSSTAMRRVLVSYARRHRATKRGGGQPGSVLDTDALEMSQASPLSAGRAEEMLALDRALQKLGELNERLSRTVELRFFGGMTIAEIAEVLEIAPSTVKLDWHKAKAWLYRELYGS